MLKDLPDNHDLTHLRGALALFDGRGTALDIGAHRGIWTREMAKHFRHVVAFEPTELADLINPDGDQRIGVIKMAVVGPTSTPLFVGIEPGTENNGQSHVVPGGDIMAYTVDDLMAFPAIPPVDFMKIDVEGMEADVIEGAAATIRKHRPAVMLEENGLCARYGRTPEEVHDSIMRHGYYLAGRWNKDYLYLPE